MRKTSKTCRNCRFGKVPQLNLLSATEIAWLAGLLDGEGSFTQKGQGRVHVEMTDRDVIEYLHELTGVGSLYSPKQRNARHKASWIWCVSRGEVTLQIVRVIFPWLSDRRKTQIRKLKVVQANSCSTQLDAAGTQFAPTRAEEIAWLAGHLEGEGCFGARTLQSAATDRDTITRVATLFGTPVGVRVPKNPTHQPCYTVSLSKASSVVSLLDQIIPFLFTRRTNAAQTLRENKLAIIQRSTYVDGVSKQCPRCLELFVIAGSYKTYCPPCTYVVVRLTPCPTCSGTKARDARHCRTCRYEDPQR